MIVTHVAAPPKNNADFMYDSLYNCPQPGQAIERNTAPVGDFVMPVFCVCAVSALTTESGTTGLAVRVLVESPIANATSKEHKITATIATLLNRIFFT